MHVYSLCTVCTCTVGSATSSQWHVVLLHLTLKAPVSCLCICSIQLLHLLRLVTGLVAEPVAAGGLRIADGVRRRARVRPRTRRLELIPEHNTVAGTRVRRACTRATPLRHLLLHALRIMIWIEILYILHI